MPPQHPPVQIDDLPRISTAGPQLFNDRRIVPVRHETDILTVRLVRHRQPILRRQRPGFRLAGQMAQREPQIVQLVRPGREQEIALIAVRIDRPMQLRPVQLWPRAQLALNIMPRRHAIRIQIARRRQQVLELDPLIAANARHRGSPGKIGVGKFLDHRLAEGVFIIQHVMRKPHSLGHPPRVMNIPPRTAGALLGQRRAMVIKLQGDAHDVIAFFSQHRRHDRTVDPTRHRHHHPRLGGRLGQAQ